jgi:aminoglycoside phosphotransferase (APT) family kinase protein
VELVAYRVGNRRHDYYVLLATLRHPQLEVVIKLAGPDAPFVDPFERTARLHQLVAAQTNLTVPEIIAVDKSYAHCPWRYLIKTQIAGEELAAVRTTIGAAELESAHGQIGNAVAQLHSITFPAFGELQADGTVLAAASAAAALAARAQQTIPDPRQRELFLNLLAHRAELFGDITTPGFCHDDLHHHNILFQHDQGQWRLAAILDFDKTWAGHPESDLARLELWQGMTSAAFWHAYQAVHDVSSRYTQRRPLYQLLWCLEYAVASPQHNTDTRHVCAQLGIPPIRFTRPRSP